MLAMSQDVGSVLQHQFRNVFGWNSRINDALEAVVNQFWNAANVVDVRMGDEKRVNGAWIINKSL
jgi:hypothetical protein